MMSGSQEQWAARRRLGATLGRWAAAGMSRRAAPGDDPPFDDPLGAASGRRRGWVRARDRWRGLLRARDRGAATIFVLAIGLVLVAGGVAGAAVGAARVGRHQARVAADLGALAGAARTVEGQESACARAAQFVVANGGRVTSCRLEGWDVVVWVDVAVTPMPGLTRHATAAARAGPAAVPSGRVSPSNVAGRTPSRPGPATDRNWSAASALVGLR